MSQPSDEQQRAEQEISRIFTERLQSGQFDDLTVREVKVKALQETERLVANDGTASVVTVVVLVVVT